MTPFEILQADGCTLADFNMTDSGNSRLFARLHAEDVRFDHSRRRWLLWDGTRWKPDQLGRINELAREAAEVRYLWAGNVPADEREKQAKWAIRSESRHAIRDMLALAQSEQAIRDSGDGWDPAPHLLGTPGDPGQVVNLKTGEIRAPNPIDRITMLARVPYDPEADAPRWERFLDEVFPDSKVRKWVQVVIGYCLTGETEGQFFLIFHGLGGNGKSKFLDALAYAFHEYAINARPELFAELRRGGSSPDLGQLDGPHLVTCSELDTGVIFRESRIKSMTGCDRITYRPLYLNNARTFVPCCKIALAVNALPLTRDLSPAFWRRVRLLPFTKKFDPKDDPNLEATLRAEVAGILAWAVQGAVTYYRDGLETPKAVTAATAVYREDSDPLARFIEDRCETGAERSVTPAELWREYLGWAEDEKVPEGSRIGTTRFYRLMAEGFERDRLPDGTRVYRGVEVRS